MSLFMQRKALISAALCLAMSASFAAPLALADESGHIGQSNPKPTAEGSGSINSNEPHGMGTNAQPMDHGAMDPDMMNHGSMDHSSMGNGSMGKGMMNHGEMDHSSMGQGMMNGHSTANGNEADPKHAH